MASEDSECRHADRYTMVSEGPIKVVRDKELLLRWMETAAVTDMILRSHQGAH